MQVNTITDTHALTLSEDKIFPDKAAWLDKNIVWLQPSDYFKDPIYTLFVPLMFLSWFSLATYLLAVSLYSFPPAILLSGAMFYLGGIALKNAHQVIPLVHAFARQKLLEKIARKEILIEDICKRVDISFINIEQIRRFTEEQKKLFYRGLIYQAQENPMVFFDHFEQSFLYPNSIWTSAYGYRALVLQEGLMGKLSMSYEIKKEVIKEIENNINKIPVYVLLLNYHKLKWLGINLEKFPKLQAFLRKKEADYAKLELTYKRVRELIEKIGKEKYYSAPASEDLFLPIFTKANLSPFSYEGDLNDVKRLERDCNHWLFHQLMALEQEYANYEVNHE